MSELKLYEIFSSSDWDRSPDYYLCDKTHFEPLIEKARKALNDVGGDYMVFWWIDENPNSMFVKHIEYGEFRIASIDGRDYSKFTDDDCEIEWGGTHLKVFKNATQLFWESKYTDEKLWCDLE
jgi:hypothetical protein